MKAESLRHQIRQRGFGAAVNVRAVRSETVAAASVPAIGDRHAQVVGAVEPVPAHIAQSAIAAMLPLSQDESVFERGSAEHGGAAAAAVRR